MRLPSNPSPGAIAAYERFLAQRPVAPTTPTSVTMRQARLALRAADLLTAVEQAIDSLPEPQRTDARIEWEYATEVARHWPLLIQLCAVLGLSDAQIDALFVEAAKL